MFANFNELHEADEFDDGDPKLVHREFRVLAAFIVAVLLVVGLFHILSRM